MTSNLLGISVTGLKVAQSNLSVTGHNIANASVEGYSRQTVISHTNPATLKGGGYVGNGVNVASIERVANEFVTEQLRIDTSLFTDLEAYNDNIDQLDRLLSDPSTGLSGGLASFFSALQNGADDPTSIPSRQLIISESKNLADKFNTIHARLDVINDGVDKFIGSAVSQINSLVDNIAKLNQRIADAIGTGGGSQPNDLLDQRDQSIKDLSALVGVQSYSQGFGQVNVVMNSGQNLVVGTEARQISLVTSDQDARKRDVVFENGDSNIVITDLISGGELGGLLRFQNTIMDQTYNELGRIAVVMADTFNQVHSQGLNLDNEFGRNFFYDVNDELVARNRVVGNSNNSIPNDRVLSLNIADSAEISADDYEVTIEAGGLIRVSNLNTGIEVTSSVLTGLLPQRITFDGLELVFEGGSFQAGDAFKLLPTRSAGRDFSAELLNASSIAFGSPLVTDASIGNIGSGSISQGELQGLEDIDGNPLPLFATSGQMSPPLVVQFTSANTYEVLDNSDPGRPISLVPPIRNQRYIVGSDNVLFSTDPGETLVQSGGDLIGLPVGRIPVTSGTPVNGYPAEAITITQTSDTVGVGSSSTTVFSSINATARETASVLNNVAGVTASAFTYAEITDVASLSRTSPLQISLNGEDLIEYEYDSGTATYVVSTVVPDPTVSEDDFNDYLADRINNNAALSARGIFAVAGVDPTTGISELRVTAPEGDDLQFTLEADGGGPDTLNIGDGSNPVIALTGAGAGNTSALAVGGTLDIRLADNVSLATFPPNSLLFGDTTATNFARSTYLGIQASIQGVPDIGDTFTLNFNVDAASDNRNALALGELQNRSTVDGGTSSYSDSYSSLVEIVGIETASSRSNKEASERVLEEITRLRDSISAVNLDEEASNLIKYEQMFSANAQVISVARDLFERLINAF